MLRRTCLAAVLLAVAGGAQAQAYPAKPIRLVVGFSAGGAIDEMARTVGAQLASRLGQQVVIDNRPGAASTLAAEQVANAPADGHTLLFGVSSTIIARHMQRQAGRGGAGFDVVTSFAPVAGVGNGPLTIAVTPSFPARDMEGFVREVRAHPGKYFYATSGIGSLHHLGMEQLMKQLGLKMQHVAYKGASQLLPDLMAGQVPVGVVSANVVPEQERAGKLRVIGLMNAGKLASQPQWRSMSEVAPGFNVLSRMYVVAPAGTPKAIVDRLDRELAEVLKAPALLDAFARQGTVAQHTPAAALGAELARENQAWAAVVRQLDLKSD